MRQPVEIALFTDDVAAVRHFYELLRGGAGDGVAGWRDLRGGGAVRVPEVDRACDELR